MSSPYGSCCLRSMTLSVIALLFGATLPAAAAKLSVANDGVDSGSCGSATPCRSISQAMANAASGDTIEVGPGRYGDINGDNFTGSGDEQPDPSAGPNLPGDVPVGCIICITKSLHIYSLQGAATTVIASDPGSKYGSTVMILHDGVDFGAAGFGFTLTGGSNNGATINFGSPPSVVEDVSVAGNIDLGDANGFAFYGAPFVLRCLAAECPETTARISLAGNQAINNSSNGFYILRDYCCYNGVESIIVENNSALGAATGFAVDPGGLETSEGGAITAGNVQLVHNVATAGGVGFSANQAGNIDYNTAVNNSSAGFVLVPGGASFYDNSAIGNGGPGVIINYVVQVPPYAFPEVLSATFAPFDGNNFIGNDRARPVLSEGLYSLNPGPSAHCGVLNLGGLLMPPFSSGPPPAIQLAASKNYWGSATGPSAKGPGDAAGGACDQNNAVTLVTPFSTTPWEIRTLP